MTLGVDVGTDALLPDGALLTADEGAVPVWPFDRDGLLLPLNAPAAHRINTTTNATITSPTTTAAAGFSLHQTSRV